MTGLSGDDGGEYPDNAMDVDQRFVPMPVRMRLAKSVLCEQGDEPDQRCNADDPPGEDDRGGAADKGKW